MHNGPASGKGNKQFWWQITSPGKGKSQTLFLKIQSWDQSYPMTLLAILSQKLSALIETWWWHKTWSSIDTEKMQNNLDDLSNWITKSKSGNGTKDKSIEVQSQDFCYEVQDCHWEN